VKAALRREQRLASWKLPEEKAVTKQRHSKYVIAAVDAHNNGTTRLISLAGLVI
jgi:hypothetical protein